MKYLLAGFIIFFAGCSTTPLALKPANTISCTETREIYVISHGWHTGISFPAEALNTLLPELKARFPASNYYEIGLGDTGFYQSQEITTGLTLRAMFWSDGSVIHLVGFNEEPQLYFPNSTVKKIKLSRESQDSMLRFIQSSFKQNRDGHIIPEKRGIYGNSQFYTGVGTYHLFNTCNKWTAKALYSAGLDISPMLKLTSSSVMDTLSDLCPAKPIPN